MKSSALQRDLDRLKTIHRDFESERKRLLNHPRMLQYLFEHPVHQRDDIVSASATLSSSCNPVVPSYVQVSRIENYLISLMDMRHKYSTIYNKLVIYRNRFPLDRRPRFRVPYRPPTKPLIGRVENQLDKLNISFVTDFSFRLIQGRIHGGVAKPYNCEYDLNVDLLGCISSRHDGSLSCSMYFFAVMDDTNKKQFDIQDYIDQYCLRRMRIHLFRMDHRTSMKDLVSFIRKIKRQRLYHSFNSLVLQKLDSTPQPLLVQFHTDYQYNHTTYCKYYQRMAAEDWDLDKPIKIEPEPDAASDCIVPKSFVQDLIAMRYIPN